MAASFLKTLLALLEPISLVWLLLTGLMVVLLRTRQRLAAWLAGGAWVVLSLGTCTNLGTALLASLERPWLAVDRDSLPVCDAVVVLGGGMAAAPSQAVGVDFREECDRVLTGIELIRQGKAGTLVVSGGASMTKHGARGEAEATRQWIAQWHLVSVPVESLGICANTYDEALRVKQLADTKGWQCVLLVTSASHLTRAEATFRKAGVKVVSVPGAYQTKIAEGYAPKQMLHVPELGGLWAFSFWLHEVVGWWVYRANDWL